jgi:outer membrane immunogenic protein
MRSIFPKLFLTTAAVAFAIGAASAADLPARTYTKAPIAPVAIFDWTGFYIGGNIGGGWTDDVTSTAADPANTFGLAGAPFTPAGTTGHGSGVMGGMQLGYNWRVANTFLLGIEGDISGADVNFSTVQSPLVSPTTNSNSSFTTSEKVRALASVRGRAGFISGDWLFFGTAGWAWADTSLNADAACVTTGVNPCGVGVHAPFNSSSTRNGAAYGGGIDYHVPGSQWILGLEYLRYDLGGVSGSASTLNIATGAPISFAPAPCAAGAACVNYSASSLHLNEVRFSASYKFGAPMVGGY